MILQSFPKPAQYRMMLSGLVFSFFINLQAQTILNTENMAAPTDSALLLGTSLDGNFQAGNVNLAQINTTLLLGKRVNRHMVRFSGAYRYLSKDERVISSDIISQFRYNYALDQHSVYAFTQTQKVKSLKMNYRFLLGGGYRHNFYRKDKDYFDISTGLFYEKELYLRDSPNEVNIQNVRLSNSAFIRYTIAPKTYINTSVYYQLNLTNIRDLRFYFEPRLYHDFSKVSTYLTGQLRYHSTPYVDVKPADLILLLGFEFNF
jgi:hypothetical protein